MNAEATELRILTELETKRERWDFSVKNSIYGELVCSYYPEKRAEVDCVERQFLHFFNRIKYDEELKKVTLIHGHLGVTLCTLYARTLLKEKICQNIDDAMHGLFEEMIIQTICKLNKREFSIENWDNVKALRKATKWHEKASAKRIKAIQGKRKNYGEFYTKAYKAFCSFFPKTDFDRDKLFDICHGRVNEGLRITQLANFVTQEKLAEALNIGVRSLAKQQKGHEISHNTLTNYLADHWYWENDVWELEYQARKILGEPCP